MKIVTYFLSSILIARLGGATLFGTYTSILSVTVILTAISALGLNSLLAKEFINSIENSEKSFSNALAIRITSSLIFFSISLPLIMILVNVDIKVSILSSLIIILCTTQIVDLFFESRLKSHIVAKYKICGYSIGFLLKVLSVYYSNSILLLVLSHLVELTTIMIISIMEINKELKFKYWFSIKNLDNKYAFELINKGIPLTFSSVAAILYMKIDQVFIVNMLGKESAGHYSAAVRLCEGVFIVSAIIVPSIFPNMVSLYKDNIRKFDLYIGKFYFLFLTLGSLIAFFIWFFSDWIIISIYGGEYEESINVLKWYCLSIPVVYLGDLFSRWIITTDNIMLSIKRHVLGLSVNVTLNLILIPKYGISGAAIASFIGYLFAVIIFSVVSSKGRFFYNFMRKSNEESNKKFSV